MRKIQSQGVHHITLAGADRQTSIDFHAEIREIYRKSVPTPSSQVTV